MTLRQPRHSEAGIRVASSGPACAYLAQRQRDRVGIITFDNDLVDHVPPSAKHFNVVLHTLDRAKARAAGQPGGAAQQDGRALQAPRHPRADCRTSTKSRTRFSKRSSRSSSSATTSIVFHVLDQAEIDFGFDDASSFEDLESGEQIPVVPAIARGGIPGADQGAHRQR